MADSIRIDDGHDIELRCIGTPAGAAPTLVFLHEGLGCVAMWRDFPDRIAAALGWSAIVYSRFGYGRSTPWSTLPEPDFMHRAAQEELPRLLAALDIDRPVLVGHSDGGSIALIAAAGAVRARAVVAIAPHVFIEAVTIEAIARTRAAWHTDGMAERLARHHSDPAATFDGWTGAWMSLEMADWNIESFLPAIDCPVLAIQGDADQYGSLEQVHRVGRGTADGTVIELAGSRHSPHLDAPEATAAAIVEFLRARVDA
ncbi:MAG: alpha/beta hydrolase [Pseudomonadota bacterium]|nr:alpha/beta hydrolase [Pseudomonadota bacterium]